SDSFSLESGEYSQRNQKTNIWFDLLRSLTIQTVLCSSEIPGKLSSLLVCLMGDSSENSKRVKLSDGRFLAYRESGVPKEEAKYKIILVHGFGSSKDMNFSASKKPDLDFVSQELIQELGVYLLFYDRSGYGKSDSNAKRSLKSEVNDIVELADQLEIGPKFYLIGLSMGSYPTWGCLKHIPRRLSGVAFVAPVVNYLWPSLPNELIKEDYMGGLIEWGLRISKFAPRLLHWLVILIQKVLPSTSSVLESKQVYFNSHDMEVLKRTTGFPMFTKEKLRERDVFDTLRDDFVACFGQWDFEPEDLSITQESNVHIWHGKEDKVVPFQLQRCVLQKQPLINYHEIPQGGHLIVHYDGTCDAVLRPYLLYRNAAQEVNGIWFYNQSECEELARLFDRLLSAYSKVNQKPNTSSSKRELEELEDVPTVSVMDGSLEPSSSGRDTPNDPAFVNFFSSAMALGYTTSGSASGPPYQSSANPHQPTVSPAAAAPPQILSPPPLPSSSPLMPLFDNNPNRISSNNSNVHTDLVTPSSFFSPPRMMAQPHLVPGSSMPPLNLNNPTYQQDLHGTPMLQPFPPPTPPPSLAPTHNGPVINRDRVKEALLALVQENEFIDMVTRALQNAHQPSS
ncbi:unnamed protein product, partial [Brassica oleracea]